MSGALIKVFWTYKMLLVHLIPFLVEVSKEAVVTLLFSFKGIREVGLSLHADHGSLSE